MDAFDIFIAYVPWGEDGKFRPVLVYAQSIGALLVYPITTQYMGKSERVKAKLFEITEWAAAGLNQPSYADTGTPLLFSKSAVYDKNAIGRLSNIDQARFSKFLDN